MKGWKTGVAMAALAGGIGQAAVVMQIDESTRIELGIQANLMAIVTESDVTGDGRLNTDSELRVRRARVRLRGAYEDWLELMLQTEAGSGEGGAGLDMRLIDAYVILKPEPAYSLIGGMHLAPSSRQTLNSASTLLAWERPAQSYKALTWGTRANHRFTTSTYAQSDAGLRGDKLVRDSGATIFGTIAAADQIHIKYWAGLYEGVAVENDLRATGRVQVNFGDPEPGYFLRGTYLGTRRTLALGASYDMQNLVAREDDGSAVDYRFTSIDLFAEQPLGPGSVTFEAAWQTLDLGGAAIDLDGDPETPARDARRAEGDGFYVQAGYLLNDWMPWVLLETWTSNAPDKQGSYDAARFGVTRYFSGQRVKATAAYEVFMARRPFTAAGEDTIRTATVAMAFDF